MKNVAHEAFCKDLIAAVAAVMKDHNLVDFALTAQAGTDPKQGLLFRIAPLDSTTPAGVTPNAIARYKANMHKLGLPALGTVVRIPSGTYMVQGLSSDLKRVKAIAKNEAGAKVKDLPLDIIVNAIKTAAAKQVSSLNQTDFVEDPTQAAAYLAKFTGAK